MLPTSPAEHYCSVLEREPGLRPCHAATQSSKSAEKAAKAQPTDLKSLNVRQYLEATVVAVLMKGMQEVRLCQNSVRQPSAGYK